MLDHHLWSLNIAQNKKKTMLKVLVVSPNWSQVENVTMFIYFTELLWICQTDFIRQPSWSYMWNGLSNK